MGDSAGALAIPADTTGCRTGAASGGNGARRACHDGRGGRVVAGIKGSREPLIVLLRKRRAKERDPLNVRPDPEAIMSLRPVREIIRTTPTIEGAGVKLERAFGFGKTKDFDPFLLLDDFRNDN